MDDKETVRLHVVFNITLERGYPADPLSLDRESVDFSVHSDPESAENRLLAELDTNLSAVSVNAFRRSYGMELDIPAAMCASGSPHRWISDRSGVLLSRCGVIPGVLAAASSRGELDGPTGRDAADTMALLLNALNSQATPRQVTARAMMAAGAAMRGAETEALPDTLAARISDRCRDIASAAWNGDQTADLGSPMQALAAELDEAVYRPSATLGRAA